MPLSWGSMPGYGPIVSAIAEDDTQIATNAAVISRSSKLLKITLFITTLL
jgi:hypothetical protein